MAEQQRNTGSDPFSSWREWLNESERQWNNFLNGVMGTDQFGQFLGQFTNLFMQMPVSYTHLSGGKWRYLVDHASFGVPPAPPAATSAG